MEPSTEPTLPAGTPSHAKDRPPVGRFLALFATMLAVALSLASLTPPAPTEIASPAATHTAGG